MAEHPSAPPPGTRPTMGGKSLENLPANPYGAPQPQQRQPYKSWRKKYRKMRIKFEKVLEENKALFKEDVQLESLAKRLREEIDGLLDIALDLNETPSLPPELRYNISEAPRHPPPFEVPANITPEHANAMVMEYRGAVQQGSIPPLDLHVVRNEIEQTLAAQDTRHLDDLIARIPTQPVASLENVPEDVKGEDAPGFMTAEQEEQYLLKLDAKLGDSLSVSRIHEQHSGVKGTAGANNDEDKHFGDMTNRELERYLALNNPHSEHSWLKSHHKLGIAADGDETESLASHENPKPPRKRGGKNLAKQVGDRAIERAREGASPGGVEGSEDELSVMDDYPSSGKKRQRDPDSTYRIKGGTSGSTKAKGKRKRTSGEVPGESGSKKPKTENTSAMD